MYASGLGPAIEGEQRTISVYLLLEMRVFLYRIIESNSIGTVEDACPYMTESHRHPVKLTAFPSEGTKKPSKKDAKASFFMQFTR